MSDPRHENRMLFDNFPGYEPEPDGDPPPVPGWRLRELGARPCQKPVARHFAAICRECGAAYEDGEIAYRSLCAFDDDPEPYCAACESDALEFV